MTCEKESSPEVMNRATPPPTTILEQYKIAVELYKHEDNLNWTKLNHLFYINAGLWAVVGFIIQFGGAENGSLPINFRFFMVMVSLIGMIISGALGVALWFGVRYMHNRKRAVILIEETLVHHGGEYIVSPSSGAPEERGILGRSPTTWVLKSVPIVFFIVWLVVLCINIQL